MNYQQLTLGRRYPISVLLTKGFSISETAKTLGCHRSTIYRELSRNKQSGYYCPEQANRQNITRRQDASKRRIGTDTISYVREKLLCYWSPEQISQVGKMAGYEVSHEWIYQYIKAHKQRGGSLYRCLRRWRKGKRKRGSLGKKFPIKNRRSIELRPKEVDTRVRFGDWEVDTVMGKRGSEALLTLTERKSRLYLVSKLTDHKAETVAKALIKILKPWKALSHTVTSDNGPEFAGHEKVSKALGIDFYFAHPYSAYERGSNENLNDLLRQFIPKKSELKTVTQQQVNKVVKLLNNRPKKCLGFKSPAEVIQTYLLELSANVALQT